MRLLMHHISCRVFLAKHHITQVTQSPCSPDFVSCNFWLFPKLKSSLKGKRFRPLMRFRKTRWGSWWWLGELCEIQSCLLWRGLRHHCPMYNVSCIFFSKCLYFSYYMGGHFLDRSQLWKRRKSFVTAWMDLDGEHYAQWNKLSLIFKFKVKIIFHDMGHIYSNDSNYLFDCVAEWEWEH